MKQDDYLGANRPFDWQDRVVIRASVIAIVVLLCYWTWGPK